jgi:flagellar motor switch protein FliG
MQKAAALLMSLEPDEAGRLLEGFDAQVVKELAAEMAEIEDAGECTEETFNAVRREMLTNIHGHKNTNARVFMEELF